MVLMIVHARPELNRSGKATGLKGDGVMGASNEARTTATSTVGNALASARREINGCAMGASLVWAWTCLYVAFALPLSRRVCGWVLPPRESNV
jgi:hypothetical protein